MLGPNHLTGDTTSLQKKTSTSTAGFFDDLDLVRPTTPVFPDEIPIVSLDTNGRVTPPVKPTRFNRAFYAVDAINYSNGSDEDKRTAMATLILDADTRALLAVQQQRIVTTGDITTALMAAGVAGLGAAFLYAKRKKQLNAISSMLYT